ncbi:DUF3108 domain-containing protein [Algihabitans albus]|uniref:DUF3108 domain-containing protein n=1 Tax=Algihabitans albus TaxID=2164067 RepID=UPI000E5CA8C9|nr:DUF3108 domain-containing protein [Algihabitans albus]
MEPSDARPFPLAKSQRTGSLRRASFALLASVGTLVLGGSALAQLEPPAFPEPLQPGAMEATYQVYSGGLRALTLQLRYDGSVGERYDARFHARSDGFLANFFTFRLDSEAEGLRTEDGLAPLSFRTEARWEDNDPRSVALTYGPDGAVSAEVVPPPEDDERSRVPDDARRGTLDPISAVVHLIEASTQAGICSGEARIFDGRRRLDVVAQSLGSAVLEERSYAIYSGRAQVCRINLEPVTGFWESEERRERYPAEIRVFLAEVEEGRPALPVRIEMDVVARGAVRAHLTDLRIGRQAAER